MFSQPPEVNRVGLGVARVVPAGAPTPLGEGARRASAPGRRVAAVVGFLDSNQQRNSGAVWGAGGGGLSATKLGVFWWVGGAIGVQKPCKSAVLHFYQHSRVRSGVGLLLVLSGGVVRLAEPISRRGQARLSCERRCCDGFGVRLRDLRERTRSRLGDLCWVARRYRQRTRRWSRCGLGIGGSRSTRRRVRPAAASWVAAVRARAGRLAGSDPGRARAEAARRAAGKVRRYCAANRLNRLGTLTYRGEGCHDPRVPSAAIWRGSSVGCARGLVASGCRMCGCRSGIRAGTGCTRTSRSAASCRAA